MSNIVVGFKFRVVCATSYNEGIFMIPEDLLHRSRRVIVGEDIEKVLKKEREKENNIEKLINFIIGFMANYSKHSTNGEARRGMDGILAPSFIVIHT